MSYMSRTVAPEPCEIALSMGRRSSPVHSLAVIPHMLSPSFAADNSTISDEANIVVESAPATATPASRSTTTTTTTSLSPLSDVHVSDYFTCTVVPRHGTSTANLHSSDTLLPTALPPSRGLSSRKSSDGVLTVSSLNLEHLKWRLASGFFAYFLCGWGDGGQACLPFFNFELTCPPVFSDGDSSPLCVRRFESHHVAAHDLDTDFTADYHLTTMTSSILFSGGVCGYGVQL
jgi:hypothetical protein